MKLFSGTSNLPLAKKVADLLGMNLGAVEITRFIDNECRVYVNDDVAGEDVFVLQSLSEVADQHLIELCLLGSALKDLGAAKVTAVIPWLGYSKQDKAFRKGEAISVQLVAKFIQAAGFDTVITCQLHSENVMQFFRIPIVELSTCKLLVDALRRESKPGFEHAVVVSPDKGGKSRSEQFAKDVGLDLVYIEKTRDLVSGEVEVKDCVGQVEGNHIIFFDDIINTGSTAIKTSEFVKKKGAKDIYFLATHAVLSGNAASTLPASSIDQVIVTDTIFVPKEKQFDGLIIVSIAPLLADAISRQTR